jgi:uncharacterized repeat protein (TIGR01451 family)
MRQLWPTPHKLLQLLVWGVLAIALLSMTAPGYAQATPDDITLAVVPQPAFAIPGETVTWQVAITNNGGFNTPHLILTQSLPPTLDLAVVDVAEDVVVVNGRQVTVHVGAVGPGQTRVLAIETQVRSNTNAAFLRTTTALNTGQLVEAEVLTVYSLPTTGETPWWRLPLILGMVLLVEVGFLLVVITRSSMPWQVRRIA